jgi:hypothetical protein
MMRAEELSNALAIDGSFTHSFGARLTRNAEAGCIIRRDIDDHIALFVSRLCMAMRLGDVRQGIASVNDRSEFPLFDKSCKEIECWDASLRHSADDCAGAGYRRP